jgi:cytochrome c
MSKMFSLRLIAVLFAIFAAPTQAQVVRIGTPLSPQEIEARDIDVRGDGANLPRGSGTVAQGREIFVNRCAACHGDSGEGGAGPALKGGIGSLATNDPQKTIGSFWPYAPSVFGYVFTAMPLNESRSLTADETYAVTAYLLSINGIVGTDAVLGQNNLPLVKMPNRNGFFPDDRQKNEADFWIPPCMEDCFRVVSRR